MRCPKRVSALDSLRPSQVRLIVFLVILSPAIFSLVTNNIWEDFFITYRSSLNLAHGNGLVYELGRKVHVFTSPLGVLIPAGISYSLRTDDPQLVMDVFRLLGCLTLAGAWWLAAGRIERPLALVVMTCLWLFDPKLAAFSTNGMETAFLVFFVVLTWRALGDGDMRLAGVGIGGLMWTRPDGFVYAGALMAATWLLQSEIRWAWRGWMRAAVWVVCLYAPWFCWAWWYYGSPIPHTILAKKTILMNVDWVTTLSTWPMRLLLGRTAVDDAFLPAYFSFGGWPGWLMIWSKVLALGAMIAAFWPGCPRPARIAGLAFIMGCLYLENVPRAPWYFPAWQVLAFIAIGGVVAACIERLRERHLLLKVAMPLLATLVIMIQVSLYSAVSVQLREQQRLVEWGVRAVIGNDLRRMATSPQETVFLEPLGYIGYFSGLAMRDTPGLSAPEVVALRKDGHTNMASLAIALRTNWVVLRFNEFKSMSEFDKNQFVLYYDYLGEYDARERIQAVEFLPGRGFLHYDAHFLLWRLKDEATSRAAVRKE